MPDYPYTYSTERLGKFIKRLRKIGVPDKATYSWLESLGYTSSNDRSFVKILKFLDFASSDGTPKDRWMDFRGRRHRKVMAEAVKDSYSELFDIYPEPCTKEVSDLTHFFSSQSTAGERTIKAKAQTFKILCDHCDFSDPPFGEEDGKEKQASNISLQRDSESDTRSVIDTINAGPEVHIDVQIHISPDSSPEQIDQIFESMAKHLYDKDE
jgi:hypothetical protein